MDFVLYIQTSRAGEQECHLSVRRRRGKSSGISAGYFGAGGGGLTDLGDRAAGDQSLGARRLPELYSAACNGLRGFGMSFFRTIL